MFKIKELSLCISVLSTAAYSSEYINQPLAEPLAAKAGSTTITTDWLANYPIKRDERDFVGWLDSTHLIYSLSSKAIEVLDLNTLRHKKIVEGTFPRLSPNRQWLAFVQVVKGKTSLWMTRADGKQKKRLMLFKEHVIPGFTLDFAWSPDSSSIAVAYQTYVAPWEREDPATDKSKSSAVDVENSVASPSSSRIDLINVQSAKSKNLAIFEAAVRAPSWLPNGKELLFLNERMGFYYPDGVFQASINMLNVETKAVRTLVTFDGMQQSLNPVSSPDGPKIAFLYDADNPEFNYMLSIGLIELSADREPTVQRLTHDLKLGGIKWASDGQTIYGKRELGAYSQIYAVDVRTGSARQISHDSIDISGYALSPDGGRLAYTGMNAHGDRLLKVLDIAGNDIQTVLNNPTAPPGLALSEVREIEWSVSDYPVPMRGLLIVPLNYVRGHRYPLIVDIHGGGAGAGVALMGGILVDTPLEWQYWASKGYAVFVPEFRSSASFGSLAITRDQNKNHDLINCDINDITAGVDMLIKQGIVDKNRVGILGHSAGGRRANWLTVTTNRFKAVVSKEGWADEWLSVGIFAPKAAFKAFGGSPFQKPEYWQKGSPIFHIQGASTPTLFLMNNPKLGGVDQYDTVRWLYNGMREKGVDAQYVKYPDEGHTLERPANRKDALERTEKWFERYLKPV